MSLPSIVVKKEPFGKMSLQILAVKVDKSILWIACFKESHEMDSAMESVHSNQSFKHEMQLGSTYTLVIICCHRFICDVQKKMMKSNPSWESKT